MIPLMLFILFSTLMLPLLSQEVKQESIVDDKISQIFHIEPSPTSAEVTKDISNTTTEKNISAEHIKSNRTGPPSNLNSSDRIKESPIDLQPNKHTSESCPCVPYYLCTNGSINTNGEGIIDIRIDEEDPCQYFDVCCKKEDQVRVPILPRPRPPRIGCGYRNTDGVGFRITGDDDNEAHFGEFPWMIALMYEEHINDAKILNRYKCGGTLIHPNVVITAAHCTINNKNHKMKARAGEWDTQTNVEIFPHQDRYVESVIIHPNFYAGGLYNDIAILFLNEPFKIDENVDVLCLPPPDFTADYSRCFATGWGKDVFGKKGKFQVILKKIELPVVPSTICQTALRSTRLSKFFKLHHSFICAGGEPGKDTCKGDGGSPLACPIPGNHDERYVYTGIVAWGIGCGDSNIPGVYVNVALFRDWIDKELGYKNITIESY